MLLNFATTWFTPMILILGAIHLIVFWILRIWAGRQVHDLADKLDRFTHELDSRSRLDWHGHLTDQIDAFVEDVHEAMQDRNQLAQLRERIQILDEERNYLNSYRFESIWNVSRSGIEVYPLLGVLGTIFALWLALRQPAEDATANVGTIVERFGLAIDSTFAGLAVAIVLMVVHSYYETIFSRLTENRRHVREMVTHLKRQWMTSTFGADSQT